MIKYRLHIILFLLFTVSSLHAEGIYLKDGRVVLGKIIFENNKKLIVRTRYGKLSLQKRNIKKIDYDQGLGVITVRLNNGKEIEGILISISNKKVVLWENAKSRLEHSIPRKNIESLVLKKFEGRRANFLSIYGGANKTIGTLYSEIPYGFIDLTLAYMRPLPFSENAYWGAHISYIRLDIDDAKSELHEPVMTINPALLTFEYQFEISKSFNLSLSAGAGVSLVTLSETNRSDTDTFLTLQPAIGFTYNITDRLFMRYNISMLYIYHKELSLYCARNMLGVGVSF